MPTVLRIKGYRFFIFSREELRKHIHVQSREGEAKFWMEPQIELAKNYKLSRKELKRSKRSSKSITINSSMAGRRILETEVTNISKHGLWLLVKGKEYFLPFEQFPWFKNKKIDDVMKVQLFGEDHLYWENLDIDLSLEMIEHPERFPLQARAS